MKRFARILLFCFVAVLLCGCGKDGGNGSQTGESLTATSEPGFFTFEYNSIDKDGAPVRLSSALLALYPGKDFPGERISTVVVACHITITANRECPTMYVDYPATNEAFAMKALTAQGTTLGRTLVIMPDYEGYGVSVDRTHPYLAADLSGRQVADAVREGLRLYKATPGVIPLADDWKCISLGYSQGGAVALATQRYLERTGLDAELHFCGSLCGDGPYDLVETFRYYLNRGRLDMPIVVPLILKGMVDAHPAMRSHSVADYLSRRYLDTGVMEWISGKQMSTGDIEDAFGRISGLSAGRMQDVFSAEALEWLSDASHYAAAPTPTGDPFGDLYYALWDNSLTHGWTPRHRVVLAHSRNDTVVPYVNCEAFVGACPSAEIRVNEFTTSNHGGGGAEFFEQLVRRGFKSDLTWLLAPATSQ